MGVDARQAAEVVARLVAAVVRSVVAVRGVVLMGPEPG